VDFDKSKIEKAIRLAFESVGAVNADDLK